MEILTREEWHAETVRQGLCKFASPPAKALCKIAEQFAATREHSAKHSLLIGGDWDGVGIMLAHLTTEEQASALLDGMEVT